MPAPAIPALGCIFRFNDTRMAWRNHEGFLILYSRWINVEVLCYVRLELEVEVEIASQRQRVRWLSTRYAESFVNIPGIHHGIEGSSGSRRSVQEGR